METPEGALSAAEEDAAATGGFEDDAATEPVATPEALLGMRPAEEPHEEEDDDEVEVPEGAKNPDAVENLIKAERKRAREANARARELQAELEAIRAQTPAGEPAEPAAEKAPSEAAEARALRLEIALDKGLPKAIALRLQGANREEMEADAEALLAEFGPRRAGGGMDGGFRQDPPAPKVDPGVAHNELIGHILGAARQR